MSVQIKLNNGEVREGRYSTKAAIRCEDMGLFTEHTGKATKQNVEIVLSSILVDGDDAESLRNQLPDDVKEISRLANALFEDAGLGE